MFPPSPHPSKFHRQWRRLHLAVLGVFILLSSDLALADKIPGTAYVGSQYFFTTKMDVVDISLWPDLRKKAERPPVAKVKIPRAYIFYISRKPGTNRDPVPSSVDAKSVNIMLTYPDGLPYSHAIRNYRKEFDVSSWAAGKALRMLSYIAQINGVLGDAYKLSYLSVGPYNLSATEQNFLGTYLGMKRFTTGGSAEIYYASKNALIRKFKCWNSPEKARPEFYCTYWTVLNKHLIASVKFVDFRVHGGIAFAEERIRVFKETICRYVSCDRQPSPRADAIK
jgi:hypothetical protein